MKEDTLLVIGMSPGNSYFKQEVIEKLLPFGLEKYGRIGIFIPDIPAISTYIALGYPENIARKDKAIPQGNSFRNRVRRVISDQKLDAERIHVFDWQKEEIENNAEYQKAFEYVSDLYRDNNDFKLDIRSATESVLIHNPFKKKEITAPDIEIGTRYILSEFAFMLFLPEYLHKYKNFVYGYHNAWPVWEKFIAGAYDGNPRTNLHFLLLPDFS